MSTQHKQTSQQHTKSGNHGRPVTHPASPSYHHLDLLTVERSFTLVKLTISPLDPTLKTTTIRPPRPGESSIPRLAR
jgi:hypothetical protein